MLRGWIVLLLLAGAALAGPASWTATEHGDDAAKPVKGLERNGDALEFEAVAGPLITLVDAAVVTDPHSDDQDANAKGACTTWYSLKFSGSKDATGHRWEITTIVEGTGFAIAESVGDGKAWGESYQVVQFSGDNNNQGMGQLAVQDGAEVKIALKVLPGLKVTLDKDMRKKGTDRFKVNVPKKSSGPGKACRVRADTAVKLHLVASSSIGNAWVDLYGRLRGDLEMVGFCRYGGKLYKDALTVDVNWGDHTKSVVKPPSGGMGQFPGDIPTDTPSDEERERGEVVTPEPVVDAGDLAEDAESPAEDAKDPAEDAKDPAEDAGVLVEDAGSSEDGAAKPPEETTEPASEDDESEESDT